MGMTKDEFKQIVKGMKAIYSDKFIQDQTSFDVWYGLLRDLDYMDVAMATQKHMQTSTYEPKPADIRRLATAKMEHSLSEEEVIAMVHKAMRNGIYGAEEEFAKLPEIVQKAVGSADNIRSWAMTEDLNHEVIDSNVMRGYRNALQEQKINDSLNPTVKKYLQDKGLIGGDDFIGITG